MLLSENLTLDNYFNGEATICTYSLDLTPFPLKQNDQIKMHFSNGWTNNSESPICESPFSEYLHDRDSSGLWISCKLDTSSFISGNIKIYNYIMNPVNLLYIYIYIIYDALYFINISIVNSRNILYHCDY